ncbi:MAG: DinB family protein [Pyrinomonadaceae bacterium]|nr:DinB family protein [Pyrinomonadaceae bacterium]MBP9109668.1 DinB family protein [Pyrinomonadaceae bacterium]
MLKEILIDLYERDLNKLKAEIERYTDEADLWKKPGNVPNSAGNLCLHLNGNLQHFFGTILGGTGYIRDRDAEFSKSYVPRAEMLADIDVTLDVVRTTLAKLTDANLAEIYPIEVFGKPMATGWFITHLSTHLTWHLGQINYHRQMVNS